MGNNITRWPATSAPNLLLGIDPGASYPGLKRQEAIPYLGAALFQWGTLVWAALIKCPTVSIVETTNAAGETVRESRKVPPFARPNMLVRTVCKEAGIARHGASKDADGPHCHRCGRGGKRSLGEGLTVLACENPLLYAKGPARPKDIIALKSIYGAVMGGIDAEFYSGPAPAEWRGSVDDIKIINERIVSVLNTAEKTILIESEKAGRGGLSPHTLAGVGVALYTLGRADTGMVI